MKLKIAAFHAFLNLEVGAAGAFISTMKYLKKEGAELSVFSINISDEIKKELEELDIPYFYPKSITEKFLFLKKISQEVQKENIIDEICSLKDDEDS
jgi:hypothetical protein